MFAALAALVGGAVYVSSLDMSPPTNEGAPAATAAPHFGTTTAAAPRPVKKVEIDYVVKPNDTLGQIFTTLRIDVTQLPDILSVPIVRDKFKPLKPGDALTLMLENGALHGLKRRISEAEVLSVTRSGAGFTAKVITTPIEIKTAQVRGTINASLFAGGRAVGLTPEMVQQLASVFGSRIDFALDIRPGDRFNVVYEQRYRDATYQGDGHIIAAELISNGETHRAIRYASADGKIDGYFTPDGHNVRGSFLRAPIDFTRVNANAHAERQPVITTLREHNGIDYPAPVGTMVRAAADGRIKYVADNGEYGNTVIIEHGNGRSTLYAHLSGFVRNAGMSQYVKQGETIGYVGNTGASTAPHLHYEYRVNGKPADPSTAAVATNSIPDQYLADFQSKSAALLASLERSGEAVVASALSR